MDAANELYGSYLKFTVSRNKIADVITQLRENYFLEEDAVAKGSVDGYTAKELQRVEDTLRYQAAKYSCFFTGR